MFRVGFIGTVGRTQFSDFMLGACPAADLSYETGSRTMLSAALATGRLDLAVYPGIPLPGFEMRLLYEDRIVAAVAPSHPLARARIIRDADWQMSPVLIPAQFGAVLRDCCPRLAEVAGRACEMPFQQIGPQLARANAIALLGASQRDGLGEETVPCRPAGRESAFPIRLSWSFKLADAAPPGLIQALAAPGRALSSPAPDRGISPCGRAGDDVGRARGKATLG